MHRVVRTVLSVAPLAAFVLALGATNAHADTLQVSQ
jgi:hypothetical protein